MDKLLLFRGKSENGIFTYVIDSERPFLEKTAAEYHPTIAAYINSAKKMPGKTQILLTALGAGEWWGNNVNGDYFPEAALAHEGDDYGYKTFVTTAKIYKHHINKDPKAAYGDVALSVYNPKYHRVELIVVIDNEKAPDIASRMESGDYPDWSMGCLLSGSKIRLADGRTKLVENIAVGDFVLNKFAKPGKVTELHPRPYAGEVFRFQFVNGASSWMTHEHPVLVYKKDQIKNGARIKEGSEFGLPEYLGADSVELGDYLCTPYDQTVLTPEYATKDLARVLGWYLAEGHVVRNKEKEPSGIQFSVHQDGSIFSEIETLCKALNSRNTPVISNHSSSPVGKIVSVYDDRIAKLCLQLAGSYSHNKVLDATVMQWDPEIQMQLLGTYLEGDGWQEQNPESKHYGSCYWSTCNETLAYQISQLLLRNGIVSRVGINNHQDTGFNHVDTREYVVEIRSNFANQFVGIAPKVIQTPEREKNSQKRIVHNGLLLVPVRSVERSYFEGAVFNFEVEGEHSYVADGIVTHNCRVPFDVCSICGNKAPTRQQYCEHLKYYMGKIHPDTGKMAYAINTRPKFFDISQVLIGADKIAKTLKKVAHASLPIKPVSSALLAEKMAVNKAAAITKEIPASEPPASQKELGEGIAAVKAQEPVLPRDVLDSLGKQDLSKVMSTLSFMGILPKPQEFQRVVLISIGKKQLADDLDSKNMCFDPMMTPDPKPVHEKILNISGDCFCPHIMKMMMPHMESRSYAAPHLSRRVIILSKTANKEVLPTFIKFAEDGERKPLGILPLMALIAGLYAAIGKKSPTEVVGTVDRVIEKHPMLAVALAASAPTIFNHVAGTNVMGQGANSIPVANPDTNDMAQRIEEQRQQPFLKVGSFFGPFSRRVFLGIPAVYMASGVLQKHKNANPHDQESRIRKFVRQYPDVVGMGLGIDALMSFRGKGTNQIFRGIKKGLDAASKPFAKTGTDKTAGPQDYISGSVIWPLAYGPAGLPARMIGGFADQVILDGAKKILSNKNKRNKLNTNNGEN
ncbi:MAG: hypothetical protein EBZ49_00390 [Proteobacteria bacterium]|nr:hypothetical protein [Pseudomonadota bacterium]